MSKIASKSRAVAVDPGTMFFQVAELLEDGESINFKAIRNAFVELQATEDIEEILAQNAWHYVKDEGHYYVVGEDALKVARMFPKKVELRRPMQDGVLNKGEEKKMLIMAELINSSIGKAPDKNSTVCSCVSSPSADGSQDSKFHRARLEGMFKANGWDTIIVEEGFAVIISEGPKAVEADGTVVPLSGIGLSLGAGRANCVLVYRGMPILGASVARGGDWVDQQVAAQTDTDIAEITAVKEKQLDFTNLDVDNDVIFALDVYYGEMIKNAMKHFAKKFITEKTKLDTPIDMVVAGGTAMPKGFCEKLKAVVDELELPFTIKSVKLADDPRNAVVKGCLKRALVAQRKKEKKLANKGKDTQNVEENKEQAAVTKIDISNDPATILGE